MNRQKHRRLDKYLTPALARETYAEHGTIERAAAALGCSWGALAAYMKRHGIQYSSHGRHRGRYIQNTDPSVDLEEARWQIEHGPNRPARCPGNGTELPPKKAAEHSARIGARMSTALVIAPRAAPVVNEDARPLRIPRTERLVDDPRCPRRYLDPNRPRRRRLDLELDAAEVRAVYKAEGTLKRAGAVLGVSPKNLQKYMVRHGIPRGPSGPR